MTLVKEKKMDNSADVERHIQQTVDRLHCIKNHLPVPNSFQSSARELLEWCSDLRAFQKPFEESLMQCLTVVSQVAPQPGFDLDLGYRLLAVCGAHRDKLSPKAASLLSSWCEELSRLLLLRHQKNCTTEGNSAGMHTQHGGVNPPMTNVDPNGPWLGNQGQGGQSLSVVTTVWGTTQSTQSGPFIHNTPGYSNTTMSTTNYTQHPQGFPTGPMQKTGPYPNPNMPFRRDSGSYQRPSGYPPTPNTPGTNTPSGPGPGPVPGPGPGPNNYHDGQAGNAALSAALVAAAATATATATATASMVMHQDQNSQQQMQMQMNMNGQIHPGMGHMQGHQGYNNQYPGMAQRPQGHMMPGHGPGPAGGGPMMNKYARRPAPYQNPSMIKRQPYLNGTQYPPQGYGAQQPQQQQFPMKNQYPPSQQPLPSPTYGAQQGMRPNAPPHYANGQTSYLPNANQFPQGRQMPPQGQPPYSQYNNTSQPQNMQPSSMNYPHSPLPGNPTPPITPGAVQSPYPGQMGIKKDLDELRLTFPVRDGVVLPPFRLEHNLAVSNHVFHLRDSVFETLMWRADLELQLKCFHHEDRQMNTNWPASVTVSVNANPLNIERGDNKSSHKPLYLKNVCQAGRNTIQITVTACCCSHLFVLQLVHRPSVKSVLHGLLRKRLLPAEHCITKIKRNFSSGAGVGGGLNGDDGVEPTAIKVPLNCPITIKRITLPARGHECKHIQCFDLESYLQLNCDRGCWRCPVCNKTALLEGLEIDQFIWSILNSLSQTEFDEITIDSRAAWKPVHKNPIKEEETTSDSCSGSRWLKAMSPSSMQMPTMNSWDPGRQASPFPMRPASQGPVYPGMPGNEAMTGPGSYPNHPSPMDYPSTPLSQMSSGPMSHMSGDNSASVNNSMHNDMHSHDNKLHNTGPYTPVSSTGLDQPPGTPSSSAPPQQLNHGGSVGVNSVNNSLNHPSSLPSSQPNNINNNNNNTMSQSSLGKVSVSGDTTQGIGDLTFDTPGIIDGEDQSTSLDLDNLGDPIELLSYLGPSDNSSNDPIGVGSDPNSNSNANTTDDLFALFD